jgi:hypothetical protein
MNFNSNGDWVKEWVYTKRPPEHRVDYETKSKLYNFDLGGEYGHPDENGVKWYRINCMYWFGDWIEENGSKDQWQEYGERHRAIYIVREDLFAFIKLKWL